MNIITLIPETLCKHDFVVKDRAILDILSSVDTGENFCNFHDGFEIKGRDPALHQSCFLHLVTETVFDYPHNSFSEKTWKPIVNLRPFVIVGVPGSLVNLKSLGFKTFSNWWDESYDDIQDPVERMRSIVEVVKTICGKSIDELIDIYESMKPVLRFNYDHYYGQFMTNALDRFNLDCQKNLLPR